MAKRYTAEQKNEIVSRVNALRSKGNTVPVACKAENVIPATYYSFLSGSKTSRRATAKKAAGRAAAKSLPAVVTYLNGGLEIRLTLSENNTQAQRNAFNELTSSFFNAFKN